MSEKRGFLLVLSVVTVLGFSPGARAGDGVVALQTADPSCPDDSGNIYVDCDNGTVTDNRTGLVWLKNASCLSESVDLRSAMGFVAGLADLPGEDPDDCGLSDGSSPGEWRLPSLREWQAMTGDADTLGCTPAITNDAGDDCWDEACVTAGPCSIAGVASSYWSSTSNLLQPEFVYWMSLSFPLDLFVISRTSQVPVWPVRGGQ